MSAIKPENDNTPVNDQEPPKPARHKLSNFVGGLFYSREAAIDADVHAVIDAMGRKRSPGQR